VITYSDDVLYNWALKVPSAEPTPALDNLRCLTLFTGKRDEEEFYLSSARIELRGVDALEIMRATMDELFVGDDLAARRITRYLHSLVRVIDDLARLLLAVRDGCEPEAFYHEIRPWFNGADSGSRKWTFEGLDAHPELALPTELSGPSAAQSSLIHSLDAFLGVNHTPSPASASASSCSSPSSHSAPNFGPPCSAPEAASSVAHIPPKAPFLTRMRAYMPRHHRNFLRHLGAAPRPLRAEVARMGDAALTEAYNAAVDALRRFRDAHLRIVALYIVGPSRRGPPHAHAPIAHCRAGPVTEACGGQGQMGMGIAMETGPTSKSVPTDMLRGTGGTDMVRFLKGVRDRTSEAAIGRGDAP
jgi:indoleamine 2,3-dioxygenase